MLVVLEAAAPPIPAEAAAVAAAVAVAVAAAAAAVAVAAAAAAEAVAAADAAAVAVAAAAEAALLGPAPAAAVAHEVAGPPVSSSPSSLRDFELDFFPVTAEEAAPLDADPPATTAAAVSAGVTDFDGVKFPGPPGGTGAFVPIVAKGDAAGFALTRGAAFAVVVAAAPPPAAPADDAAVAAAVAGVDFANEAAG